MAPIGAWLLAHGRLWAFRVYVVPSWVAQDARRFVPPSLQFLRAVGCLVYYYS